MKIAVVGGGLAGLAVSFFLLQKGADVELYEEKTIGSGASGIPVGLMHPYVGESGKRSIMASEGMEHSCQLMEEVERFGKKNLSRKGIVRKILKGQEKLFASHEATYGDLFQIAEDAFFLKEGRVIDLADYTQTLFALCLQQGLKMIYQKIDTVQDLCRYDRYVLTAGSGILSLINEPKFGTTKGQILKCTQQVPALETALLGKGHLIPVGSTIYLGSTYERGKTDDRFEMEVARKELEPKALALLPSWNSQILGGMARVRVHRQGHLLPFVKRVGNQGWVMAAFGSRGLLYHALFAKQVVEEMVV